MEYVFLFENRGAAIGATLPHPHGQIYAFPYVPPTPRRMLAAAGRFREAHGRCLMCDVVAREAAGPRVVAETDGFLAYVPEAARWPYEVYVAPRSCVPDLPALDAAQRDELMGLYADVLRRFDALYEQPTPYMACWYQAPARTTRDAAHLCARVYTPQRTADKLKFLATSETGAGAYINDAPLRHRRRPPPRALTSSTCWTRRGWTAPADSHPGPGESRPRCPSRDCARVPVPAVPHEAFHQGFGHRFAEVDHQQVLGSRPDPWGGGIVDEFQVPGGIGPADHEK